MHGNYVFRMDSIKPRMSESQPSMSPKKEPSPKPNQVSSVAFKRVSATGLIRF